MGHNLCSVSFILCSRLFVLPPDFLLGCFSLDADFFSSSNLGDGVHGGTEEGRYTVLVVRDCYFSIHSSVSFRARSLPLATPLRHPISFLYPAIVVVRPWP